MPLVEVIRHHAKKRRKDDEEEGNHHVEAVIPEASKKGITWT
jgi:hypothetical protein